MKILYLHGLYSKPGGVKPTFLARQGFEIVNPHLPDDDFEESVRRAREARDRENPDLVVGSSRGGGVALNAGLDDLPIVLIAPAWKRWGTARAATPKTWVLHSEADQVIPIADSRELLEAAGLPASRLTVVGKGHDMTDEEAFRVLVEVIGRARRG